MLFRLYIVPWGNEETPFCHDCGEYFKPGGKAWIALSIGKCACEECKDEFLVKWNAEEAAKEAIAAEKRKAIDLRQVTRFEHVECNDCGLNETYSGSLADAHVECCPKCKSRAICLRSTYSDLKKEIPAFVPDLGFDPPEDWSEENDADDYGGMDLD